MVSRLDKLFELLESNNSNIRSAAAIQIGKITSNSQVQIPSLLHKLLPYVKHKTWAVRIAAADAVKHIGINSKLWVPSVINSTENKIENFPEMIRLEKLNLLEILKIGTRLYSTDIKELDDTNIDTSVCENEISRHLGFIIPEELDIKDIISNDDYEIFKANKDNKMSIKQAVEKSLGNKSKKYGKRSHNEMSDVCEPDAKILCTKTSDCIQNNDTIDWPWADFCNELLTSLWNPKWEIRHGAATSLRELVRSQGSIMICKIGNNLTKADYTAIHIRYQEDVVGRLLCTLALDQLSDFVSDEIVGPVRESCAQVLGIMSVHLSETLVLELARNLLSLLDYSEWTVNHGALLGLKYLIAARMDLLETLLPILYDPISSHLKDNCDDDVRCAAASAIIPIFNKAGTTALKPVQIESLRLDLWDVLILRSDCTSPGSTCAVLNLLEKLYEYRDDATNTIQHCVDKKLLDSLINRLHLCYYSYSESVRLAAVRTCRAMLQFYEASQCHDIVSQATMQQIMSQLIQRVLVDDNVTVAIESEQLWQWLIEHCRCDLLAQSCLERLDVWMCAAMQPARLSYSGAVILMPETVESPSEDCKNKFPNEFYIGGRDSFLSDGSYAIREDAVLRARLAACRLLAGLCRILVNIEPLVEHILITILTHIHLKERLAVQRFVAATILAYWHPTPEWILAHMDTLEPLRHQLLVAIEEPIYYQELLPVFRQMLKACRDLLGCYLEHGVVVPGHSSVGNTTNLNLVQCQALLVPELVNRLSEREDTIVACAKSSVEMCSQQHIGLGRLVEISVGRALLDWHWLPGMLTPLIRPLMDAIRSESRLSVQREAGIALAQLVHDYMGTPRFAGPIGKLVKNLVQYLSDSIDLLSPTTSLKSEDIIVLHKIAQLGRDAFPAQEELPAVALASDGSDNMASIKLRGSRLALENICEQLIVTYDGGDISLLLKVIYHHPMKFMQTQNESSSGHHIVAALQTMVTCLPNLMMHHRRLGVCLISYAECVFQHGLSHDSPAIRHWSARVLSLLMMPVHMADSTVDLCRDIVDRILLANVLSALISMNDENQCLGSIELVYLVMHRGPLPYRLGLVMSVLPVVLRCLSAPLESVRRMATHIFSLLLTLLPLEEGGADLGLLNEARRQERQNNIEFLAGLLHPDSIDEYTAHEAHISVSLRHYQKQGVNWLSFLNRYGLHGVLADDMGLGKTLQTIAIIVGEHCRDSDGSDGDFSLSCQPSLVVCPPTLTGHWHQEIARHVRLPGFSSVVYNGSVDARLALYPNLGRYQVVITSYDILRNDIDRLIRPYGDCDVNKHGPMAWNYLVLDEGHLIRNHKSKIAMATKSVCAKHRLVLTGTPIQNRVTELWSLFDFLMPGLLGSHPEFQKRFGRVLDHHQVCTVSGNPGKKVDGEVATLALEQLHRQVLPFMLRRVKEDVLNELPPKLMQDYMCTMSPLQARLYQYCLASRHAPELAMLDQLDSESPSGANASIEQRKHVFQALHYLRLVCNHPRLALCDSHPLYQTIRKELAATNCSLEDITHSGKLLALKQLILDCGIGSGNSDDTLLASGSVTDQMIMGSPGVVSNHRLLVFCQSRSMIAMVEQMIKVELPRASLLRLDGSVPIKERQVIVDKFNQDASIDMLLLTTSIGGLGLNLTSADVVIFVEHDWNPMRDLQAMDRAHRIGQKNTVNVYRLITSDSIEEKIMNLQKFKLFIASNVVSADNKQFGSMNTEGLLDTMNKEMWAGSSSSSASVSSGSRGGGYKAVLASMEGVYESVDEYDDEYSLESFVQKL